MRRFIFCCLATISIFLSACEGTDVSTSSHMIINGSTYNLSKGIIYDYGTDSKISYRTYKINFKSDDTNLPENYFSFYILSTSTERLQEGTYSYSYYADKGQFSEIEFGYQIQYDESGQAISGTRLSENFSTTGEVEVSKESNGNYRFEINGALTSEEKKYNYSVVFNQILTDAFSR